MNTELLISELMRVWKNDTSMVDFCLKTNVYVQLENNMFVDIGDKSPKINSTIYYRDDTKEPEILEDFFVEYNLKPKCDPDTYFVCQGYQSMGGAIIYNLVDCDYPDAIECTNEQIALIRSAREDMRNAHIKRLKKYYKRYKNKIRTVGYWADR